jgi:hypothetical protein
LWAQLEDGSLLSDLQADVQIQGSPASAIASVELHVHRLPGEVAISSAEGDMMADL